MKNRNSIIWRVASALRAICLLMPGAAHAADFYSGKTITLIVSSNAGGGYDIVARLLARYLPKYIPGTPMIVVQNEAGGGGLRAAQQIYAVAAKDGTTIGNLRASNMLDSILAIRGKEIDPTKYEWIGSVASDTDLCSFWYTAGVHSFEDLKNKEIIVGASGKGAQNYSFPSAINTILHTKMKIVVGYVGIADRVLAMERGELQGNCGINSSTVISQYSQLIAEGKLIPIVQSGVRPYSGLPNVPLTQSFAATEKQKRILVAIFSQMEIANVFAAPVGTPKERVEILRKAFMQALSDPGLIDAVKQLNLDFDPMSGEEVAKVVADMSDLPDELKAEVRAAIGE
jgi:tripartite-type tricarboxylate transporter receptor subunit TctC